MTVEALHFLASYYNMSIFQFQDKPPKGTKSESEASVKREYLLEINPNYLNEGPLDPWNMIDARWIDTSTGLYIDITTVRANLTARAEGTEGALSCKDRHHYVVSFPESRFSHFAPCDQCSFV